MSVGSVACFSGIIVAEMALKGINPVICVLVGLVGAAVLGVINGWLINVLDLHPFVVTLGTNTIFRGVCLVITGGNPVFNLPPWVKSLSTYVWVFPNQLFTQRYLD